MGWHMKKHLKHRSPRTISKKKLQKLKQSLVVEVAFKLVKRPSQKLS